MVPGLKPKTNPVGSTNATAGLLVLQVPPLLPVVNNWVAVLAHMAEDPMIVPALAPGFTVTLYDVNDDPQVFVIK